MTREDAKEFLRICKEDAPLMKVITGIGYLDIIQAFADGEDIESFTACRGWEKVETLDFMSSPSCYRITTKYVPFDFNTICGHDGAEVVAINDGYLWRIESWNMSSVFMTSMLVEEKAHAAGSPAPVPDEFSYDNLLKRFRFKSGKPCGRRIRVKR